MAYNQNWGEVMTSTLALRRKDIGDGLSRNNVIWAELRRRGRIKKKRGGRTITAPILIGDENTNFMWYHGRDPLAVSGMEVLDSAEFAWKQYACAVSMSGFEMLINSGESEVIDVMATRIEHAKKTIMNQMNRVTHADGTLFGGREFGGLGLIVAEVAGATVGGIPSGSAAWWDSQRLLTGAAPDKATIYAHMLNLRLMCSLDTDRPNLISSDNSWYSVFAQSLQAQQRFSNAGMAAAGFENIMFESTPVVADGGLGGYAPAGMKFLNLNTFEIVIHSDRDNAILGGPKRPLNEDSETAIIAGMGNFTNNNRRLNGVLRA